MILTSRQLIAVGNMRIRRSARFAHSNSSTQLVKMTSARLTAVEEK